MKFDIKRAFTYMYGDKRIVPKFLIAYFLIVFSAVLSYMPNILKYTIKFCTENKIFEQYTNNSNFMLSVAILPVLFVITDVVITIIWYGYNLINTNLRITKPEEKLLEWKGLSGMLITGLKLIVGEVSYLIPFILLIIFADTLMTNLKVPFGVYAAIIVAIVLIFMLLIITGYYSFLVDLRISSFFNFKNYKSILIDNFISFIKCESWLFLIVVCYIILLLLCAITVVGLIVAPYIIVYTVFVLNDIHAQFMKHVITKNQEALPENS